MSAFVICSDCGRCSCGAAPLDTMTARQVFAWRRDHRAMHEGQTPTGDQVPMLQPSVASSETGTHTLGMVVREAGPVGVYNYALQLQALVRWFAMQYPTEPEWHFHNQFGQALPAAEELAATYRGVIG